MIFPKPTILLALLFCLLTQLTCHKNRTESKTGTLTGTVLLEGKQDQSGISVALYKLAELDTTILRYNREYPFTCRDFGRPVYLPVFGMAVFWEGTSACLSVLGLVS